MTNPLTNLDYPDPDVIRVDDTYYLASTTMHFFPGCAILRSRDLIHWEHAAYVYTALDHTPAQRLTGPQNIYGQGMWAPCLRWHKGTFYLCFAANDTRQTYLFTAPGIQGPWTRRPMEGFYHDSSLLFDDDGRVYIAYGNKQIHIRELKPDLSAPLEGGLDRIAIDDAGHPGLGFEGTHFYKIGGRYYLFNIHSLRDRWRRVESCHTADSLEGEFTGGDVLNDDMGYCGQGVAQGGIVDTPEGKWYAVLFQDRGAVGRIPVLVPVTWQEGFPVLGVDGKVPLTLPRGENGEGLIPLTDSDNFTGGEGPAFQSYGFKSCWQFNHEPDLTLVRRDPVRGRVEITTDKLSANLPQARNTLTQRMPYPGCRASVLVDASGLKEGDYAGICALQGCYGLAAVTRRQGRYLAVMLSFLDEDQSLTPREKALAPGRERACAELPGPLVRLELEADFTEMKDTARFYWYQGKERRALGEPHRLYFRLDHFTGCRVGLVVFSTAQTGGRAAFSDFRFRGEAPGTGEAQDS